jgi:hypothetical protein
VADLTGKKLNRSINETYQVEKPMTFFLMVDLLNSDVELQSTPNAILDVINSPRLSCCKISLQSSIIGK